MAFKIKLNTKKSKKAYEDEQVKQLITLFPNGDPDYFRSCLGYYNDNAVERIADKLTTYYGRHYPQLPSIDMEHPDDNRLNACLRILALDLFPNCDIAFLRDKVLAYSYAHIENVTRKMLSEKHYPERLDYGKLDPSDGIRSERYKKQAFLLLTQNYPQVWKSSIKAVLAENNYDYLKSYDQLKEMGSGGFWYTLKSFFTHWPVNSSSASFSSTTPSTTDMNTLDTSDRYLTEQLKQLQQRDIDKQVNQDLHLAQQLNYKEYEKHDALLTCNCCYLDEFTFEQLMFCTEGKHSFCHDCIHRYLSEGLFGQGNLRGKATIACIASSDRCEGCLSLQDLERILPADVMKAYDLSLLEMISTIPSASSRSVRKIQCCACSYFELDETMMTPLEAIPLYSTDYVRWTATGLLIAFVALIVILDCLNKEKKNYNALLLALSLASPFLFRLFLAIQQWDVKSDLELAYHRVVNERRGTTHFQCKNETCRMVTCLNCRRPVKGIHKCFAKDTDGLRLYVEKAMADAVKRTCPNCMLSYQKSDGCNKIVCRCGYTMCYVCRKDIKRESYGHFCDHFREIPGSGCTKCNKCDLYKTDPEDKLVKQAAAKAKKDYLQAHPELVIAGNNGTNRNNNSLPHIVIGPKTTADRFDEWRRTCLMWCLEKAIEFYE